MSRYSAKFAKLKAGKEGALVGFTVLGDPTKKKSLELIKAIAKNSDILELGLPFSDPIADGPTIQAAVQRSLDNGFKVKDGFSIIREFRKHDNETPIGLLTYTNIVMQAGIGSFYRECGKAGVDSVLVADLPVEEADEFLKAAKKNKVEQVFIIAPTTTDARLKKVLAKCAGFVYVVSLLGVTGARSELHSGLKKLVKKVKARTRLPVCVGFGVSEPRHVKQLMEMGADGAIIGSAIVSNIAKGKSAKDISRFVAGLKNAAKS